MPPTAGDERDWDTELAAIAAGLDIDTARCKHGDHRIHKDPLGDWIDEMGVHVCVKAPASQTGYGQTPDYIFHEPAPEIP
jgi:hypothetical protein